MHIYCLAAHLCLLFQYLTDPYTICFIFLICWHQKKKSSHNGGKLPCCAVSVLLSITSHIWCTPQNTLRYKSGRTRKNCQSKIVFFCFYLTNHPLPFYVNLIPPFYFSLSWPTFYWTMETIGRPLRAEKSEFKYQKPTMDITPDSKELHSLAPTVHLLITGEMREEG